MNIVDRILRLHTCRPNRYASPAAAHWRCVICGAHWDNHAGKWVRVDQPNT